MYRWSLHLKLYLHSVTISVRNERKVKVKKSVIVDIRRGGSNGLIHVAQDFRLILFGSIPNVAPALQLKFIVDLTEGLNTEHYTAGVSLQAHSIYLQCWRNWSEFLCQKWKQKKIYIFTQPFVFLYQCNWKEERILKLSNIVETKVRPKYNIRSKWNWSAKDKLIKNASSCRCILLQMSLDYLEIYKIYINYIWQRFYTDVE